MKHKKKLTNLALMASMAVVAVGLAGCTSDSGIAEVNEVTENTEQVVEPVVDTTTSDVMEKDDEEDTSEGTADTSVEVMEKDELEAEGLVEPEEDLSSEASAELEWQTYTNNEIGASFSYLKNWDIDSIVDDDLSRDFIHNNDDYENQLVNMNVMWSDRHEDIELDSGVINYSLDRWLDCSFEPEINSICESITVNGIEVVARDGEINSEFGDKYKAYAYSYGDQTVLVKGDALIREVPTDVASNTILNAEEKIVDIFDTLVITK